MFGRNQAGLTLVELLISVVILGILMAVIGPIFSNALTFMEAAKKSEVQLNNQKLASGMLSYARNHGGKLPPQRPSDKYRLYDEKAVKDDGAPYELFLELSGTGVAPNQINTTGYGINATKLYQVVDGLTHVQPLFFSAGDKITLTYQVGVIYQSNCPLLSGCSSNPFADYSGKPRTKEINSGNIVSWDVEGDDYAPVMINTLAEQKTMLRVTIGRLNRLSDRISSHYYAKARASGGSDNYFAGVSVTPTAKNDGCWVAWDNLSSSTTLASLGLDRNEYGKTAWGGGIEYCREYNPSATVGGSPPFYAALRINKDLSKGIMPVPTNANANVIVTF